MDPDPDSDLDLEDCSERLFAKSGSHVLRLPAVCNQVSGSSDTVQHVYRCFHRQLCGTFLRDVNQQGSS